MSKLVIPDRLPLQKVKSRMKDKINDTARNIGAMSAT